MARSYGPGFDPEYETLSIRINPPRVSVDNVSCKDCTLVKFNKILRLAARISDRLVRVWSSQPAMVDSINKPGILLEVVQILTDLDLVITKAYISSDGGWFMDVFHVTDQHGNKVTDSVTIGHIEKALGPEGYTSGILKTRPGRKVGENCGQDYTTIELIGQGSSRLLSEISAVLANLHFNVAAAETCSTLFSPNVCHYLIRWSLCITGIFYSPHGWLHSESGRGEAKGCEVSEAAIRRRISEDSA
ncbi:Arsenical-resistance protein 3 [Datura stramonium]|uniref:ACT domain-containing protein ACR n=1 Tax=Datura stramonium TaxID=4076 RepID=A0ABS8V751_DATST|nr:Arsenical-resistance protein 3 [Datura stramonium]